MVPELRKFKRETYILAQTADQLDSSSVVGGGLPKSGASPFQKEECFILQSVSKSNWSNLRVQCCIAETR